MSRADLEGLLARTPFSRFLGLRPPTAAERETDAEAVLALDVRPEFVQEAGRVHGGVLTSLADSAGVYALLEAGWHARFTGVELKLNFVRPVALDGPAMVARARIVQSGRRVALCDVEIAQAGKLLAKGLFTYLAIE